MNTLSSVSPYQLRYFLFFLVLAIGTNCNPPQPQQGGRVEKTPNLEFNKQLLSPITIVPPLLTCGTAVTVKGFVPGAMITIFANGAPIANKPGIDPIGQTISVSPALVHGQTITAVQEFQGAQSNPSAGEIVKDHTEVYPNGLPKPDFPLLYLYNCGIATFVNQLPPGGDLKVFSREPVAGSTPAIVGQVNGVADGQSVGIGPAFIENRLITATSQICTDISPVSDEQTVKPAPGTLPLPEVTGIYEGGTILTVHQLVNGAAVTIKRAGTTIGGGGAPGPHVRFHLNVAVSASDHLDITQELCGVNSPTATVTVQPCSSLPPAKIMAPRAGDQTVTVIDEVPGSTIYIFASGQEIGRGGGTTINLIRPLEQGETIIVLQGMGTNCFSSQVFVLEVGHGLDDPLQPGPCGQGIDFEYGQQGDPDRVTTDVSSYFNSPDEEVTVPMNAVPLHALVKYPNGPGPFPLVLIVHGNHDPNDLSYPGYNYLLDQLASHCIIAVSVEEDFLNGWTSGEMDARAIVLLRHLQLWREWNRTPGNRFYGKVDMGSIGLSGHSRGGEAIVAATVYNHTLHNAGDPAHNFNFNIRACYAIAPVDGQFEGSPIVLNGADYYIMHGTHDGDVSSFAGHKMYDRAFPVTGSTNNFKGLLWVYGANHAQWNTVWTVHPESAVDPTAQLISPANQQLIGKSYITSFFLASLKGWSSYRYFLNGEVTFPSLPSAITRAFQYQDPHQVFLNHYEEDNDPATGSYTGLTNTKTGSFDTYTNYSFNDPSGPHFLTEQTNGLIAGWRNSENAEIHIQIPHDLAQFVSGFEFLAVRVAQTHEPSHDHNSPGINKDFDIQIMLGSSAGTEVKVSDYEPLPYPMVTTNRNPHSVMQTIRIPWKDLLGKTNKKELTNLSEIIFKFNRQTSGLLAIDEIQFTN